VLNHLGGTAVPVPGVHASESDPRFLGAPFLLLEFIDAAHMPAPEADFATFAADLSSLRRGGRLDPRDRLAGGGIGLPRRTEFRRRRIQR
jgi:hypothetical protein